MWTPDYFVRLLELPPTVEGVTVPNDDGTFDIYINALLSEERQREKLEHELEHIRKNHFYDDIKTIKEVEAEADGKSVVNLETQRVLPLFTSLDALLKYARWKGLVG